MDSSVSKLEENSFRSGNLSQEPWPNSSSDIHVCYDNTSLPETFANRSGCPYYVPFDPCNKVCHWGHELYLFDEIMRKPSSIITYGQVYPVLVVITVVTNACVLLVLSQRHMRTPTNMVLLYMAVADLSVALVPFPFMFFYNLLGNYRRPENIKAWWCHFAVYTTDALPPFCHNVAIWLAVLLAAQRFVYIQYPMSAHKWCTIRNVKLTTILIVLISLICASPKFFDITDLRTLKWELRQGPNDRLLRSQYRCIFQYSALVRNVGPDLYFSSYYWTRVLLFVLLPSVLLVLFSLLLIRGIRRANDRKRRLLMENRRVEARKQKENNSTSLMLLVVVVIFLVVNLPQGIILATFCISQVIDGIRMERELILLATNIDNMLILATYPLNFAIYCSMSAQFRHTFRRLLCRAFGKHIPADMNTATPVASARVPMRTGSNKSSVSHYVQLANGDGNGGKINTASLHSGVPLINNMSTSCV